MLTRSAIPTIVLSLSAVFAPAVFAQRAPTTAEHRSINVAEGRALSQFVRKNWCEVPGRVRVSTVDQHWAVDLVKLGDCRIANPNYRRVPVLLHRGPAGRWQVYHLLFAGTTAAFACEVGNRVARDLVFRSCP